MGFPKYLYIYLYEYIYICEKLDVMILLDDESEPRVSVDDKLLFNYHSCISDLSQFYCCFIFSKLKLLY